MNGGEDAPDWIAELLMAEDWRVPPWQLDAEAPAVWVERWAVLRAARAERERNENADQYWAGKGMRRLI